MEFSVGQGILGKIRFKDGAMPQYDRTYLVVGVDSDEVQILNISSLQGKEHKLLRSTNKSIDNYEPPFKKPSFVKLDSLVSVPKSELSNIRILHGGDCLNRNELEDILSELETVLAK